MKVYLDMNLTEDFAAGLLLLARDPEVELMGITLSYGETDLATAVQNTAGICKLLGLTVPVAAGAEKPWRRDYTLLPKPMPLCDAIDGLQLDPTAELTLEKAFAPEFLYEKLKKAGEKVTLFCAGPLTNIAYLLERHPDARGFIEKIIWRGGTQRHATLGIVKDLQTYLDPDAAAFVLQKGIPFVMCPVDMGFALYATQAEVDAGMAATDPVEHQLNRLLKRLWNLQNEAVPMGERNRPLPLQDVAAVRYLTHPEAFAEEKFYCEVDLRGKLTFGMAVVDIQNRLEKTEAEKNITLLRDCDREALVQTLYQK